MTDKERLEEIKDYLNRYINCRDVERTYRIADEAFSRHIGWLINRVEELETAIKGAHDIAKIQSNHIAELEEKIERYETALSFYATEDNYITFDSPAIQDYGKIARNVLEGKE